MNYVRTAGGSMMPINFKNVLLVKDKNKVEKKETNSKKQKKRSLFSKK